MLPLTAVQVTLLGERDRPLAPTIRLTDATCPALPEVPAFVEPRTLVQVIWRLGVDALASAIQQGATLSGTGALVFDMTKHELGDSPAATHKQRVAATAAAVREILPKPVTTKIRRPKQYRPKPGVAGVAVKTDESAD